MLLSFFLRLHLRHDGLKRYLFTIPQTPLSFKRFSLKQRRYYDVVCLTSILYTILYTTPGSAYFFPYLPSGFSLYIFESVEGIPAIITDTICA